MKKVETWTPAHIEGLGCQGKLCNMCVCCVSEFRVPRKTQRQKATFTRFGANVLGRYSCKNVRKARLSEGEADL